MALSPACPGSRTAIERALARFRRARRRKVARVGALDVPRLDGAATAADTTRSDAPTVHSSCAPGLIVLLDEIEALFEIGPCVAAADRARRRYERRRARGGNACRTGVRGRPGASAGRLARCGMAGRARPEWSPQLDRLRSAARHAKRARRSPRSIRAARHPTSARAGHAGKVPRPVCAVRIGRRRRARRGRAAWNLPWTA